MRPSLWYLLRDGLLFSYSVAEIVHSKIKFSNKSFRNFLLSEINDSFIITSGNKEEIYKIISTLNSRLIEFLEEKQILYYRQFGFRKDLSTNHVILTLLENIQKALDDGQFAYGIFIDLEKAFEVMIYATQKTNSL